MQPFGGGTSVMVQLHFKSVMMGDDEDEGTLTISVRACSIRGDSSSVTYSSHNCNR
jgi:hypothetical protein